MELESGRSEAEPVVDQEHEAVYTAVQQLMSICLYGLATFQITMMYLAVHIISAVSPFPGLSVMAFCDVARLITRFHKRWTVSKPLLNKLQTLSSIEQIWTIVIEGLILVWLAVDIIAIRIVTLVSLVFGIGLSLLQLGMLATNKPRMRVTTFVLLQYQLVRMIACSYAAMIICGNLPTLLRLGYYVVYFIFIMMSLCAIVAMQSWHSEVDQSVRKSQTSVLSFMLIFHISVVLDTFIVQWLCTTNPGSEYMSFCIMMQLIFNFIIVLIIWKQYASWREIFIFEMKAQTKNIPKPIATQDTKKNTATKRFSLVRITNNFFKFKPKVEKVISKPHKVRITMSSQASNLLITNGPDSKNCVKSRLQDLIVATPQQSVSHIEPVLHPDSQKSLPQQSDEFKCAICFVGMPNTVFYPCGHGGVCQECAASIKGHKKPCPFCRADIAQVIEIGSKQDIDIQMQMS